MILRFMFTTKRIASLALMAGMALGIPASAQKNKKNAEKLEPVKFQTVYTDMDYQPTGIAVSSKGRIFISFPKWSDTYKNAVVEMYPDGATRPYPNEYMNSFKEGDNGRAKWVSVQSVFVDELDQLWVVDPASPNMEGIYQRSDKLVKIDLKTDQVVKTYTFDHTTDADSYINDVRIDNKNQFAYLTNSSTGGIIVLNLENGKSAMYLTKHASVKSDPSYTFKPGGKELETEKGPAKIHSDGIALSPDMEYLYYKPLTDNRLYRIETKYLRAKKPDDAKLAKKVEDMGYYNTTDGMIFDGAGNLYMGDIEENAIVRINTKHKKEVLMRDARLSWPDSYAIHGGYLYISCSQIQHMPKFNGGESTRKGPYAIYRMKL
jgi:sugar lactone lactonase YvrE